MKTIAIHLQSNDDKVIHPLTWQYLYNRWIDKGIGPQRQTFRREPNREKLAFNRLDSALWDMPIVQWVD